MLNLIRRKEDPWPEHWKPVGEGEREEESFENWWRKHESELSNLPPEIASQWIYRHWKGSPLSFLDPRKMHWIQETLDTKTILRDVHLEWGQDAADTPERDYEIFRPDKPFPLPTGQRWENGSWLHPLPILRTLNGIIGHDGEFPKKRFLVIDGSKRYRWLRALKHHGTKTGPHQVYILTIDPDNSA